MRRGRVFAASRLAPLALACSLACSLAGCTLFRHRPPPPPALVRDVPPVPYRIGGVWQYPTARFDLTETGLAAVIGAHAPLMTDGARYDPTALVAAHRTAPLPCVAQITNLETGRQILVRIEDRGPDDPGRAIALSPRAAQLLGPGSQRDAAGRPVLRVRVQVLPGPSQTLEESLPGGQTDRLPVQAAPVAAVQQQALAPPPGAVGRPALSAQGATAEAAAPLPSGPAVPARLPEQITLTAPAPAALFIQAGAFSRPEYARLLAGRMPGLGAVVDTDYFAPRDRAYRVRIGPFATVAEADAMLDRALRAGVVDARIVVDPPA